MTILVFFLLIILCFILFLKWRTNQIFEFATNLFVTDRDKFNSLPGYKYMRSHFWIWPLDKFISINNKENNKK